MVGWDFNDFYTCVMSSRYKSLQMKLWQWF